VVRLRPRSPYTLKMSPGTHFGQRLSRLQGQSAVERIRSTGKSNDIGNRTSNLPACRIVPQPTTQPRAPFYVSGNLTN
jgi:hypothetical protein